MTALPNGLDTVVGDRGVATYVVKNGTVIESGNWNVLSARPGRRFRAMRQAQELGA